MVTGSLRPRFPRLRVQSPHLDGAIDSSSIVCDQIVRLFAESPYHELKQVQVTVSDTQVRLDGVVWTYFIKQAAQETARPVSAGRQIVNEIQVAF